jgi:hypothetical protein
MGDEEKGLYGDVRHQWIRSTVKQHFSHINEAKFDKIWDTPEQM